ncbi:TonB C-terminal domain-containing protein [Herminiimonas sp. CN]|uniref:TonB C-terminal domain-containing protein n=1 Tax=Herminiimonas sp. CN TaxID=1349818 RepID=UPI000473C2D3|nr:TonB C-terminal domain-containing protein [Herminiimonas sp. CN]
MKFFHKLTPLSLAVAISLLLHGALLAVHFAAPQALRFAPADPGLEVILVNARRDKAPLKAEALAQANLDGGGNAAQGRAKSPLPDSHKAEDGQSIKAARRRQDNLEAQQKKLMEQLQQKDSVFRVPAQRNQGQPQEAPPQPQGADPVDSAKAIARMEAEIAKNVEDYNKRPKRTQITPSTRGVGYAMYYKALQERIEKIGTLNFPQKDGRKLYGELIVSIPVFQDGTIFERDGGPRIERSSGIPELDRATLAIIRRSAPFGRFPENMRSVGKDDLWEVVTRFKFTREEALETVLNAPAN